MNTQQSPGQFDKVILGIDPGTNIMGYAIIGINGNRAGLIKMDAINLKKAGDAYLKLSSIYTKVQSLVSQYLPDEMAIEAQFYGKNIQSMLKLGRAQGVAIAAALSRQVPISEYEPRKIKMAITGSGSASKEQVREMLIRLLGISSENLVAELDATDALAIAMCHYYETNRVVKSQSSTSWAEFIKNNPLRVKSK